MTSHQPSPVSSPPEPPRVVVSSPADLLGAVPYLIGFHPADSVVLVGSEHGRVVFTARHDLPARDERAGTLARYLLGVLARQHLREAAVICYGPPAEAGRMIAAIRAAAWPGLHLYELLRVTGDRWWSYCCEDPACCPPAGTPLDPAGPVAAACAVAGLAPLPDRAAFVRQVAPVEGLARAGMQVATDRAGDRFLAEFGSLGDDAALAGAVRAAGAAAVRSARRRYDEGDALDDDAVAWLAVLLLAVPVRDDAWAAIDGGQCWVDLWRDVTRRADPELVPAPATLLGYAAWRGGDGALAGVALERALREDPDYTLAKLLGEALRRGIPPTALGGSAPDQAA